MTYSLAESQSFIEEHQSFIERFARTIETASSTSGAIVGAKDIHSRHLTASDAYARIVGLRDGKDVAGRRDHDMPCEGTARFADCYVREDRDLLDRGDPGATTSVLNIHRYETGLTALVFDKFLLKHHPTKSILGIVYSAYETSLERFTALFPGYWTQFGFGCSIERADVSAVHALGELSPLEYEVAFLLAVGVDAEGITHFLRRLRPGPDASEDISAALAALANKATAAGVSVASLREALIEARVHQRMPASFFGKVVGSHNL